MRTIAALYWLFLLCDVCAWLITGWSGPLHIIGQIGLGVFGTIWIFILWLDFRHPEKRPFTEPKKKIS